MSTQVETRQGPMTVIDTRRTGVSQCYSILRDSDGVEWLARHQAGRRITRSNKLVARNS